MALTVGAEVRTAVRTLVAECLTVLGMDLALFVAEAPNLPAMSVWAGSVPPELEPGPLPPVPVITTDTARGPAAQWDWLHRHGIRFLVGVPVTTEQGLPAGALYVMRSAPGPGPDSLLPALQLLGRMALGRISRCTAQPHQADRPGAEAEWASFHIQLTGLPGRPIFARRVAEALEQSTLRGPTFAILALEVAGFHTVHDSLGHSVSDQLMLQAAQRLRDSVPASSTVAHADGWGFAVLLKGLAETMEAVTAARAIQTAFGAPFVVQGYELLLTPTIGLVMGDQGQNANQLLHFAHLALQEARRQGVGGCAAYRPAMSHQALHRLEGEEELRAALRREEFVLHYQPVYDLQTGQVAGAEALVRWNHPRRGLLGPCEFIPLAEQSGLIVPLGRWVLRTACRDLKRWEQQGLCSDQVWVAVNLSARQLCSSALLEDVRTALAESGLPAGRLGLELTETALIEQADLAAAILKELEAMGVGIALDDFGVGYASLSYLQSYRIKVLKLDRSFMRGVGSDPRASAIAKAIIELARAFGLSITAEGLEEPEQADWCRRHGVARGQGYGLARPHPSPFAQQS